MTSLYCDGGVIGSNPSKVGGTWAVVIVKNGADIIGQFSGVVTPEQAGLQAITNNYTELLAAAEALERMPDGWRGTLYTDSNVTRWRLTVKRPKFKGIPADLVERVMMQRKRLDFTVVLLDGHPTRQQLLAGYGKRGSPVSEYNVLCDHLCGQAAKRYLTMGVVMDEAWEDLSASDVAWE